MSYFRNITCTLLHIWLFFILNETSARQKRKRGIAKIPILWCFYCIELLTNCKPYNVYRVILGGKTSFMSDPFFTKL